MHRRERFFSGFGHHLLPTPSEGGHAPSEDGNKKIPPTFWHGFDLKAGPDRDARSKINIDLSRTPGYYAFDTGDGIPVRVIMLNSAKLDQWGADGEIDERQRDWLKHTVASAEDRLLLVFSHHRPNDFDDETLAILHDPRRGPMLFFSGHTHQHHLTVHRSPKGPSFYELNTGSVLEYPQIARLIEIRGIPGETGYLVSRALWSSHLDLDPTIERERLEKDLAECGQNREAHRKVLAGAAGCGHRGALKDYLDRKERAWGRSQPFEEAWRNANIVVPVTIPQ
jgi:hypothetical protein